MTYAGDHHKLCMFGLQAITDRVCGDMGFIRIYSDPWIHLNWAKRSGGAIMLAGLEYNDEIEIEPEL